MKSTIDNMLEKLDPYTVYIPEEETDDLAFMTSGEYAGIGAVISKQGKEIVVTEPYEGMPAQRNDVRAGDVIIEIDGKKTEGISVSDASALLKGTPNTIIQLKLKRYGDKKNIEKSFKREKIQMNPVSYYSKVADKTGYVLLTDFTDKAASEMKLAINDMPGVKDAQVVAVTSPRYGEDVGVFIIPHDGVDILPEDVKEFCKDKIARYKIPRYIFFVPEYPLTGSGKIQKFKLREIALEICKEQGIEII